MEPIAGSAFSRGARPEDLNRYMSSRRLDTLNRRLEDRGKSTAAETPGSGPESGKPDDPGPTGREDALREAAQDFEAIFTTIMFRQMRETVPEGGLIERSFSEEIFQGMLDEKLGQRAAGTQSLGIADMIYNQLRGRVQATTLASRKMGGGE